MTPLAQTLYREWMANARRWEPVAKKASHLGLQVWNPPLYTQDLYREFLTRFAPARGAALLLGLNPGPHGMSQTGIPFTDCRTAHQRLGLPLHVPGRAPKDLQRWLKKESGAWRSSYERSSLGVYRFLDLLGASDLKKAYAQIYVANPCPLLFLSADGKNVTPADAVLKRLPEINLLRQDILRRVHRLMAPSAIVCLGQNAVDAMAPLATELLGPDRVIAYTHPARAVPRSWAAHLYQKLLPCLSATPFRFEL